MGFARECCGDATIASTAPSTLGRTPRTSPPSVPTSPPSLSWTTRPVRTELIPTMLYRSSPGSTTRTTPRSSTCYPSWTPSALSPTSGRSSRETERRTDRCKSQKLVFLVLYASCIEAFLFVNLYWYCNSFINNLTFDDKEKYLMLLLSISPK